MCECVGLGLAPVPSNEAAARIKAGIRTMTDRHTTNGMMQLNVSLCVLYYVLWSLVV